MITRLKPDLNSQEMLSTCVVYDIIVVYYISGLSANYQKLFSTCDCV